MSAKSQGKAVALSDFTGQKEQNQITNLKKGDSVTILNKIPGGWWYGICERSGEKGYFPESFVKEYDANAVAEKVPIASKSGAPKWKSAVDKRYNRVYYVNSLTGESRGLGPKILMELKPSRTRPLRKEKKISNQRRGNAECVRKRQEELPRVSTEPALRRSQIQRENASLFHTKSMDNVSKSNAPKRTLESKMTAATLMTTNELQASKTVFSTKELQTLNNIQANGDQTFKIVSEMPQGFLIRKRRKADYLRAHFIASFLFSMRQLNFCIALIRSKVGQ